MRTIHLLILALLVILMACSTDTAPEPEIAIPPGDGLIASAAGPKVIMSTKLAPSVMDENIFSALGLTDRKKQQALAILMESGEWIKEFPESYGKFDYHDPEGNQIPIIHRTLRTSVFDIFGKIHDNPRTLRDWGVGRLMIERYGCDLDEDYLLELTDDDIAALREGYQMMTGHADNLLLFYFPDKGVAATYMFRDPKGVFVFTNGWTGSPRVFEEPVHDETGRAFNVPLSIMHEAMGERDSYALVIGALGMQGSEIGDGRSVGPDLHSRMLLVSQRMIGTIRPDRRYTFKYATDPARTYLLAGHSMGGAAVIHFIRYSMILSEEWDPVFMPMHPALHSRKITWTTPEKENKVDPNTWSISMWDALVTLDPLIKEGIDPKGETIYAWISNLVIKGLTEGVYLNNLECSNIRKLHQDALDTTLARSPEYSRAAQRTMQGNQEQSYLSKWEWDRIKSNKVLVFSSMEDGMIDGERLLKNMPPETETYKIHMADKGSHYAFTCEGFDELIIAFREFYRDS